MRAAFHTLGCKVNQYETSAMIEGFTADGFEIVESEQPADVYILNSCTVTAESDRKIRQLLRRFRRLSPDALICLCGCMPQAFPEEARSLTEADLVLGTRERSAVLAAVKEALGAQERTIHVTPHTAGEPFEPMSISSFSERTRAFVKIQDGCERFCTYCIIPHARGPVRSKPLAELRRELAALEESGYREVVLVGINLSCYGQDMGLSLHDAVKTACAVPGIVRVRLGSLEPELLTEETVSALARETKLCPQFHLSLQSGCDITLRAMGRGYDAGEYRRIVQSLRRAFPGCAVTTDVMVGFPGETQQDFETSLAFVREIGFARAHVFAYSRRPGTPAADMPGQIPNAEKHLRSARMLEAAAEGRAAFLAAQIGKHHSVLFETRRPDGLWEGYSENYTQVLVPQAGDISGQILPVLIDGVLEDACTGETRP